MARIVITVTNDLESDQRMHKTAISLQNAGFEILMVGRKLAGSKPISRPYSFKRIRLLFNKSVLFYACYNIRLFFFLLFHSWDIVLSVDMDSLPAAWLASKFRNKSLVFDSHELFSEVPEIQGKPFVKKTWQKLEAFLLPKVKHSYTVSQSIAEYYKQKYDIQMEVIRNLPNVSETPDEIFDITFSTPFLLYQGALNQGRGIEKMIAAMAFLNEFSLVIAGTGPLEPELKRLAQQNFASERIHLIGRISIDKLKQLTPKAFLGLSLEEDIGLSYRYALPNKIFDYMNAEIPSLISQLPEMENFMNITKCGYLIPPNCDAKELAKKVLEIHENQADYTKKKDAAKRAKLIYNWEKESQRQLEIFRTVTELSKINC
jgi:hypothetical protein